LTARGFLAFQKIITEWITSEFKPVKEQFMEKRVQAYKDADWQTYMM